MRPLAAAAALLILATATPASSVERIGYVHYASANHITQVREVEEAGRKAYIITERPSGMTYRQDYAPDGTVWVAR